MMNNKYNRKYIGKEYPTKEGYIAVVINGGNKKDKVVIKIDKWVKEIFVSNLKKGNTRYPYHPSVYGIGYLGEGHHKSCVNYKRPKSYMIWKSMLDRCYNKNKARTYVGCSVEKSWHDYQNFAEWFNANCIIGFDLDKDLLSEKNKVYSEKTCCFIPHSLNVFMTNKQRNNTSGCIGVNWNKHAHKWKAEIKDCDTHKHIHLGYFNDITEASITYKKARTTMAHRMKHKMILEYGITDLRILDAIDKL